SFLSEQELSQYMVKFLHRMEDLCAYNNARLQGAKRNPGRVLPALVYNDALFYKGFLLASAIRMNTLAETSPVAGEPYQKLKAIRRRLANLYTMPVADRSGVGELEEEAANTEKELSRLLAGYSDASRQVDWREIKSGLKSGEAALEFIHYQHLFPKPSDRILYAALLIRPQDEVPVFIPLCEEASLDSILQVKADRKADYVNGLYTLADRGAFIPKTPQRTLYELLCKPMEKELTGIQTIYFSPSGLLHRINLNAIPVNEMETLSDRYRLIELTSTRQLVTPNPPVDQNRDAVLYGAVNYDFDASVQTNEVVAASQSRGSLSFNAADGPQSKGSWGFLTGTEREVHSIEKTLQMNGFKVVLAKGENATEASIKKFGSGLAASPRVIHIATHGFFFPDPDRTNSAEDGMTRDSSSSERTAIAASQNNRQQSIDNSPSGSEFIKSDQPMLRSGLILAGGNAAWQGQPARKGQEDGVLTAYEIAQMNLSNTELVVLSACETGLGDIQGNEGVYGLQRAFKIAGVKYLIMSLWQVPDKQTSMLMIAFYKNWLDQKMSIPDAFHAAQKELRELGFDPYQWAGFVLIE
ncbi:MAG TPA: CHAT domain-containing protein, partial [Saprospiraceae bacterium]|nr:CHAT domain-containing protein [Saprospiraceae bacterium]